MEFSQWDNNIALAVSTQQLLRDSFVPHWKDVKFPSMTENGSQSWHKRNGPISWNTKRSIRDPQLHLYDLCLHYYWSILINTMMVDDDSLKQWEGCKSKEPEGQDLCSETYQNMEANETLRSSKIHRKITLLSYETKLSGQDSWGFFHLQHCES